MSTENTKTILLTGCTSGIGLFASKQLFKAGHRLILVGRTTEKATTAKNEILSSVDGNTDVSSCRLIPMGCDMSSFKSINDFASAFEKEFQGEKVVLDVVCLNAGMCAVRNSKPLYTEDGIELTLATNHFGPFLFMYHIFPWINTENGRIVITGSGVHNTDGKKQPLTFGNFQGIKQEKIDGSASNSSMITMIDGSDFDHHRSYSLSKLCNVAFCLELQRRLEKRGNVNIISSCFCPNLITETGLFRDQGYFSMSIFGFMANTVFKFGDTLEWGGGALAFMAVAKEIDDHGGGKYWKGPTGISRKGGQYGIDFIPNDVSKEAADVDKQEKLWNLSAKIVGIDSHFI